MTGKTNNDSQWHLDKRVPVAIIVMILLQSAYAVWWLATTEQRVMTLESNVQEAQVTTRGLQITSVEQGQNVAVLANEIRHVTKELESTNSLLRTFLRGNTK